MADYQNNNQNEYSIFDKPIEHNDKTPADKKSRKKAVVLISGILCVALILTSAFLISRFMPEQNTESGENEIEPYKIIEVSTDNFTKVTVENAQGETKTQFYAEQVLTENEDGEEEESTEWYIEGCEKVNVYSSVYSLFSAVSDITAYMEIDKKTAADCGLDNPRYKISVETSENTGYTILIGDNSPDNFGMYLKFEDSEKIYLVSEELASNFEIDAESIIEASTQTQ